MMGISGAASCSHTQAEVKEVAKKLLASCDARFLSGHCTGTIAYEWLKEIMGDRLEAFHSGKVFEL